MKGGTMTRCNIQVFGNVKTFLDKIPKKKKSIVVNAIISSVLKSNKINEILTTFFTNNEIVELFGKEIELQDTSGSSKKQGKVIVSEKKTKDEHHEKDDSFKVEI
jgi:hypothetical protein